MHRNARAAQALLSRLDCTLYNVGRLLRPKPIKAVRGDRIQSNGKVATMASQNVMTLTQDNWQNEVVESDKPVLVDFWAPWCGPCRALTPTIEKLADQYVGKVKVGKVNTDDNQDLAAQFGVSAIPLVLVLQGGQVKEKMVGLQTEANYVKVLNRLLQTA